MIDDCSSLEEDPDIIREYTDCKLFTCFSEKIRMIRQHPEYQITVDCILRNVESAECFKILLEELFTEKQQGSTKACYRLYQSIIRTGKV